MGWTVACASGEVAEGTSRLCELGGLKIALFHTNEGFFALDDHCPHRSGPLSEGPVEEGAVSCPWHQWVFDLRDGTCRNIPGAPKAAVYPVRVLEGVVEIDLP
jgi:NAD(P)H-dependent nitrite reductase small subunit